MKQKKWLWRLAVLVAVAGMMVPLTGCSGDDDDDAPSVNMSGTWSEVYTSPSWSSPWTSQRMTVTQAGGAVTGTWIEDGGTGTVSGSVMGNTVVLTFSQNAGVGGSPWTATGTVSGNAATGTWSNPTSGESGTWSATRL